MDNREASFILSRLDHGEEPADPNGVTAVCATELQDFCRRDAFRPDLPQFRLLCRLAAAPDRKHSTLATNALYHGLLEPLCDDFTAAAASQAHAVLAGLIDFIATTPPGQLGRELLDRLGLRSQAALLARWRQLTAPTSYPAPADLERIKTILIPSRISVGADVAITSVLAQRLTKALPGAEIILVGPDHLAELFHGLPRVRHLPFAIERHGNLGDRLLFWPRLLATVTQTLADRSTEQVLVVDSDSRLTQLGLLPLAIGPASCQFPSQSLSPALGHPSLSALANQWLDSWLGRSAPCYPTVAPAPERQAAAHFFCARLRAAGTRRLLLVNFGVGGEPRKCLPETFELELLNGLLATENTIIILDMGCGSEEKVRAEKLLGFLADNGHQTARLQDWQLPTVSVPFNHGVVGLTSSLGTLAALGSGVDCYLGYDSCGQHLANGAGTPTVTIFAGAPNPRFLERWSPLSPTGTSLVIPVTNREPSSAETTATIARITQSVNQLTSPR